MHHTFAPESVDFLENVNNFLENVYEILKKFDDVLENTVKKCVTSITSAETSARLFFDALTKHWFSI